jgi:trimethylamine:corrinoid methyltransferase-like protein
VSPNYAYPQYQIDLSQQDFDKCCDMGARLAAEVGLVVRHEKFLDAVRGKPGVRTEGDRVYFDESLLVRNIEKYRSRLHDSLSKQPEPTIPTEWTMSAGGFSMAVLDIETDDVRMATQQDLRDLIHLINSFGMSGNYPVMPRNLPPLMRALACFKICWEESDNIRPYDYLHIDQTPFLYDMHQVMAKPFYVTLTVAQAMLLDEKDMDIFLHFYPQWKAGGNIRFQILDYPMLGITKPITVTGCVTMYVAEMFSVYTLFNAFDPALELPVTIQTGVITDLRNACWAWGHPRFHVFKYLDALIQRRLARVDMGRYVNPGGILETSSSAIDQQCGIEKMATGLTMALQGARQFEQLGSMCVDDIFSGVQLVIDVEIVKFIRELVEAFEPHLDIISMDDETYDTLKEVCLHKDSFLSCYDTATKFKNIVSSSDLIVREKLRSWMEHHQCLKDRARKEAIERIETFERKFHLGDDKQKALDEIYERAEKALV